MSQSQGGMNHSRSTADDGPLVLACLILIIGVASYAAWWFFHSQISATIMFVAHKHMQFSSLFTDRYHALDAQVLATDPATVKVPALWRLMHNVGSFIRIPSVVVLLALALWCWLRNAPRQFTRDLDLPGLMRTQAETFPSAAPFVRRTLGLVPPASGAPRPADPALHGDEWIARFALEADGSYSEKGAVAELTAQLGSRWTDVADAAPHVRCLFAAFALHAARRRAEAVAFLGTLAQSLPDGSAEDAAGPERPITFPRHAVSKADLILAEADLVGPCADVAARHAFTATAMMAVLSHARVQAGVLAPAQFAFLKLVDRRLWYALHSLGFPVGQSQAAQPNPRVEAIGARDHWAVECAAGCAVPDPSLDRAIARIRMLAAKAARDKTSETTP